MLASPPPPPQPNEESYLTLSHLSQILSYNATFWPLSPELFDPIDEFDGNPSRLTVPPPALTFDSSDDEDDHDYAKTPSPMMHTEDMVLFEHMDLQEENDNKQQQQSNYMVSSAHIAPVMSCASPDDVDMYHPMEQQEDEAWHHKQQQQQQQQQHQIPKRARRSKASEPKRYECRTCHATFNRSYNLKTHELTHNKKRVKRFGCPLCGKGFDRKHDQQRHIAAMHAGARNDFACYACDTHFRRRDALVKHLAYDHS